MRTKQSPQSPDPSGRRVKTSVAKQKNSSKTGTYALPDPRKTTTSKVSKQQAPVKGNTVGSVSRKQVQPTGIIDDVISTGQSVAKTVSTLAEGNPLGLLELPNSIMKVVDTTKNIVRNVTQSDAKEKVIVQDKSDLRTVSDTVIVNKLKEQMPVLTTTQLPSSYAVEHSMPPLVTSEVVYRDGRKGIRIQGSYSLPTAANTLPAHSFIAYANVMTPMEGSVFGARCATLVDLYQMYKINTLTMQWIPTVGTDYPGNMISVFSDGTDVTGQWPAGLSYQAVSQRDNPQPASVKQGHSITVKGKGDWLYVNDSSGTGDPKFFASIIFGTCFYNVAQATTPTTPLGHFFLTFDLECRGNMEAAWGYNLLMQRRFFSIYMLRPKYDFVKWISYMWNVAKRMPGYLSTNATRAIEKYTPDSVFDRSSKVSILNRANHFLETFDSLLTTFKVTHFGAKGQKTVSEFTVSDACITPEISHLLLDPWIRDSFESAREALVREKSLNVVKELKHEGGGGGAHLYHMKKLNKALSDFVTPEDYVSLMAFVLHFFKDTKFILDYILSDSVKIHQLVADVLLFMYRKHVPKLEFDIIEPHSDEEDIDDDVDDELEVVQL